MCGIVGIFRTKQSIISTEKTLDSLYSLYNYSQSRGIDSSGVAVKNSKEILIVRDSISASKLLKSKRFNKLVKENIDDLKLIGHARMETNGSFALDHNNQPVVKDDSVVIHNGIIVNDKEIWSKFPDIKRLYEVDTEVINSLIKKEFTKTSDFWKSLKETLHIVNGSYSLGILFNKIGISIFTTNTGSIYYLKSDDNSFVLIGSEYHYLEKILNKDLAEYKDHLSIYHLSPDKVLGIIEKNKSQIIKEFFVDDTNTTSFDKYKKPVISVVSNT
ncbi:MAG: hypothetical protein WCO33_04830, partial [bacterium]